MKGDFIRNKTFTNVNQFLSQARNINLRKYSLRNYSLTSEKYK